MLLHISGVMRETAFKEFKDVQEITKETAFKEFIDNPEILREAVLYLSSSKMIRR